jgi:hypothetical protein
VQLNLCFTLSRNSLTAWSIFFDSSGVTKSSQVIKMVAGWELGCRSPNPRSLHYRDFFMPGASCGWRIVISPIIPYDSPSCYHSSMRHFVVLFIHLIAILTQLLQPGGVRSLVAESLLLKHQLLSMNLLISPFKSRNRRRQVPGTCDASKTQSGLIVNSLPASISHSILVGPHPCRLDGALGPSYSSSPFRDCSEAFYPASPSQRHSGSLPQDIRSAPGVLD